MADEPLFPEIGTLDAAMQALSFVRECLERRRPAGQPVRSVNEELGNDLGDLVVVLVQLSAVLTRMCTGLLNQQGRVVDEAQLLRWFEDAQQVHAARRMLGELDGNPFDA